MSVEHIVLLQQVEITSSTNAIRVKEAATTSTLSIAAGSYYLRGDGEADDLCLALKTALETHAGTNTYNVTVAWSTDPASPAATVTIAIATGTNTFQILWADAATTFDEALIGFDNSNTADNTSAKTSTLSPLCAWVSPEAPEVCEEHPEYDASMARARSGRVRGLRRGGPYHILDLSFALCDSRRVLRSDNTSDPAATFASFLEQVGDGTSFEVHQQTITGTAVDALDVYSRRREYWRFDEETSAAFRPVRREPGLALYAWDLVAHGYGDTTPEPPAPSFVGHTEEFETADGW